MHTTRETTNKLHRAGFPQPEPAAGQFWWHPDYADPILCAGPSENPGEYTMVMPGPRLESCGAEFFVKAVFSPTATDILQQMPNVSLSFMGKNSGAGFGIKYRSGKLIAFHEKPAEAAALAWLKLEEIETT